MDEEPAKVQALKDILEFRETQFVKGPEEGPELPLATGMKQWRRQRLSCLSSELGDLER